MCKCDSITTGRCWLKVDQMAYDQNVKRLLKGDKLAVYTFAMLESQRLHEKATSMTRSGCDVITADYCEQGCVFASESQRTERLAKQLESA
jgi:hypothetical protein